MEEILTQGNHVYCLLYDCHLLSTLYTMMVFMQHLPHQDVMNYTFCSEIDPGVRVIIMTVLPHSDTSSSFPSLYLLYRTITVLTKRTQTPDSRLPTPSTSSWPPDTWTGRRPSQLSWRPESWRVHRYSTGRRSMTVPKVHGQGWAPHTPARARSFSYKYRLCVDC